MKKTKQLIIIGGGASGIMAAITAARLGVEVTILEKNSKIGKKILATGNGRCNYTNLNADANCYFGHNPKFVFSPLASFTVQNTIDFFEQLGIEPKTEENGKVFPMSEQASSFLDVFLYELQNLNVEIITEANVVEIIALQDKGYQIRLEGGEEYQARKVILATGGKAMPSSGSDGSGYQLAAGLGHTVKKTFPALVQLMLDGSFFNRISGVKVVGTAEIIHQQKSIARDRGDILFANYGVSGPPILQISRIAAALIQKNEEVQLKINMMDQMSRAELQEIITKRVVDGAKKPVDLGFVGLINKRLIPVILSEVGLDNPKKPMASLTIKEQERIINILSDWRFKVRGTKGWQSAQVTAGGVDTAEINPYTMESKLAEGLFLAGEIIDIDGLCGGFNLQWAWSSGFLAGKNAAK